MLLTNGMKRKGVKSTPLAWLLSNQHIACRTKQSHRPALQISDKLRWGRKCWDISVAFDENKILF